MTEVIKVAKEDVQSGQLTEQKKSVIEDIANGIEKANPILKFAQGIIALYGAAAGIF